MKYLIYCLLSTTAILPLHGEDTGHSEEGKKTAAVAPVNSKLKADSKRISVLAEYLKIDTNSLTFLMSDETNSNSDIALRKKILELQKSGKVTTIDTALLTTEFGATATSSSGNNVIYPTEYDPAEISDGFVKKEDDEGKNVLQRVTPMAIGPTPTAFEERQVGLSCTLTANLTPSNAISLNFESEFTSYLGQVNYATWVDQYGSSNISMPKFYTLKFSSNTVVHNNKPALLAIQTPKDKDGKADRAHKILVFVLVSVKE